MASVGEKEGQIFCPAFLRPPGESTGCLAVNLLARMKNMEYAINGNPEIPDSHGFSGDMGTIKAYMKAAAVWAKICAFILTFILSVIIAYVAVLEYRLHSGMIKSPASLNAPMLAQTNRAPLLADK